MFEDKASLGQEAENQIVRTRPALSPMAISFIINITPKAEVITYYRDDEDVPTELVTILESKYYGYIEFRDTDLAFEFCIDYFPRRDELSDGVAGDPYWYHCYVVRQDGVIEYDNDTLRKGLN